MVVNGEFKIQTLSNLKVWNRSKAGSRHEILDFHKKRFNKTSKVCESMNLNRRTYIISKICTNFECQLSELHD